MAEGMLPHRWSFRALFALIAAVILFCQLLPLNPGPGRMPGPDVLLLVTLAWLLRRPDYVPVWLIAAVFLLSDILLIRPIGLWTALVIIATEVLRGRASVTREMSFAVEWLQIGVVVLGLHMAQTLILGVFLVEQPTLGSTLIRLIVTILSYPVVVALAARGLGLRRPTPRERHRIGATA